MRVLLDESLPHDLAALLSGHDVRPVSRQGWGGLENGELLRRARDGFDVFLTMDQNLPYQQNLRAIGMPVVLIRAKSNRMVHLRPLVPQILEAIATVKAGEVRRVGA